MRKLFFFACLAVALTACKDSIDDRAEKEAQEYTHRYCPTPVYNNTYTDSLVYDRPTRTFIYYTKLTGDLDNDSIIDANKKELQEGLKQSIKESTTLKLYKDAGIGFKYVIRSDKNPEHVFLEASFKE